MNSTRVVHMNMNDMNSTKVVHTNSLHGKVATHSGVATNSTCVSGARCSRLNSRSLFHFSITKIVLHFRQKVWPNDH